MFAANPVGWDVLASSQMQEFLLISYVDEESRGKRKKKCCRKKPSEVLSAGESEYLFLLWKRGFWAVGCAQTCASCIWDAAGTPSTEAELCRA